MSWRDRAKPIIRRVLAETKGQSESDIKAVLFDAYPFHERQYYPYKIWLDEIKVQRGKKYRKQSTIDSVKTPKPLTGQQKLFSDSEHTT